MKTKVITLRVKYSTWKEMRSLFKGKRGESMADYMERLVDNIIIHSERENENKM
jgi:hypothetical protein